MENRKENLATAANMGSFTSHQMIVCKTSMTNTETGQENFQAVTPLATRRQWTKGRFQLSQLIAIRSTLVSTELRGDTEGTANTGNIVLKR